MFLLEGGLGECLLECAPHGDGEDWGCCREEWGREWVGGERFMSPLVEAVGRARGSMYSRMRREEVDARANGCD